MLDAIRIDEGEPAGLTTRDARDTLGLQGKGPAKQRRDELRDRLRDLQRDLWAEDRRSLLLVLQGMDTAGKDSTIRRVFTGVNPQGVRVASFRKPTEHELDHDYLWRVHAMCPGRGEIGIFNRSHYEDVGVVRVLGLIDDETAARRFRQIRDWERHLVENGTTIRKVFLHISRDEQRERLQDRLDDPTKHWKFNPADLDSRARWDDYEQVYEEAITATSTEQAPWYVVPADRKWVRDVAVLDLLVETLEAMDPSPPPAPDGLDEVVIPE